MGKRVRMIRLATILNHPRDYKGGTASGSGKKAASAEIVW